MKWSSIHDKNVLPSPGVDKVVTVWLTIAEYMLVMHNSPN